MPYTLDVGDVEYIPGRTVSPRLPGPRQVRGLKFLGRIPLSVEAAVAFLLFFYKPNSFRGHFFILDLVNLLGLVKGVHQGCLEIRECHFFIILLGPYRLFPGPPEEVQAGPFLCTLSLSAQDLLKGLHIVLREKNLLGEGLGR